MLNKEQIIQQMQTLGELLHSYGVHSPRIVLGAGAALVLHGIRELTNDIDASCSPEIFRAIVNIYKAPIQVLPIMGHYPSVRKIKIPSSDIDLHEEPNISDDDYLLSADGIFILSPKSLIKQKLLLGREKDKADLKLMAEKWAEEYICAVSEWNVAEHGAGKPKVPVQVRKKAEMLKPTISS